MTNFVTKHTKHTKPLLILDLDETLLHASEFLLSREPDFNCGFYVYKRPYLEYFFQLVSKSYKLAIWSAGSKDYVEAAVYEILPPGVTLEFVWARDRCTRFFEPEWRVAQFIKPLKKVKRLGYTLDRVLIIDNDAYKCRKNYGNAIYIDDFEGDEDDDQLSRLGKYLLHIVDHPDFRTLEKRGWRSWAP